MLLSEHLFNDIYSFLVPDQLAGEDCDACSELAWKDQTCPGRDLLRHNCLMLMFIRILLLSALWDKLFSFECFAPFFLEKKWFFEHLCDRPFPSLHLWLSKDPSVCQTCSMVPIYRYNALIYFFLRNWMMIFLGRGSINLYDPVSQDLWKCTSRLPRERGWTRGQLRTTTRLKPLLCHCQVRRGFKCSGALNTLRALQSFHWNYSKTLLRWALMIFYGALRWERGTIMRWGINMRSKYPRPTPCVRYRKIIWCV